MRRPLLLLALLMTVPVIAATAQGRVRLEVTASAPAPASTIALRQPLVRTPGILRDPRWRESLANSFPLRMRFRVEIWRVRSDWFDALERSFEWETVVVYEPLADQYTKTVLFGGSPRSFQRFESLQDLETDLEKPNQVNLVPGGPGQYYFTASLQIRTLTDQEVEELERFVQGQPQPEIEDQPGSLLKATRRLLLRFGGMPYAELEARSRTLTVER